MASSLDPDSEGSRDATEESRDKGVHGHVLLFVGDDQVSSLTARGSIDLPTRPQERERLAVNRTL
jgi:hypothetical protein